MRRLALLIGVLFLAGCTRSTADFWAIIEPNRGHVPFEAQITAADIGDSYTFHLPVGSFTQSNPKLDVLVDSLDWSATVETSCGGQIYTDAVHASGNNGLPNIETVIINGIRDRWYLTPNERTLLEFIVSPAASIVAVDVWGSAFGEHYTVFIAPYDGTYHAIYKGRYVENACIVYPMYCSIPGEPGQDLPYAPTGLETGYPCLVWRNTNVFEFRGEQDQDVEIPEQSGFIRASARDSFGRITTETFEVPIEACDFWDSE